MRKCDVMETKEEQRFVIRFYMRRGKSATATFQKLKETLFSFLKKELRGRRFAQTADVVKAATNVLNKIPKCEFLKTFDKMDRTMGQGALKMAGDISKKKV